MEETEEEEGYDKLEALFTLPNPTIEDQIQVSRMLEKDEMRNVLGLLLNNSLKMCGREMLNASPSDAIMLSRIQGVHEGVQTAIKSLITLDLVDDDEKEKD